jgi:hypothetical protein
MSTTLENEPKRYPAVERLALLTGANPVPASKKRFGYEPDKFRAAELHPQPSDVVRPPRVAECPVQIEARVNRTGLDADATSSSWKHGHCACTPAAAS